MRHSASISSYLESYFMKLYLFTIWIEWFIRWYWFSLSSRYFIPIRNITVMSFVSHSSNILYAMPFSQIQQWVIENNFHREYHITMHVIILLYMVVIFFAVGKTLHHDDVEMKTPTTSLYHRRGNPATTSGFHSRRKSNVEFWYLRHWWVEQAVA